VVKFSRVVLPIRYAVTFRLSQKRAKAPIANPADLNLGVGAMENIVLLIIALIVLERIFNGATKGK